MEKSNAKIESEVIPMDVASIPYVAYEMAERRHERRERRHWIAHAVEMALLAFTVGAFVWLWNEYDTVSTIEASGLYALADSNGNVISSDIPVEKIPEIIKSLEDVYGQSKNNETKG